MELRWMLEMLMFMKKIHEKEVINLVRMLKNYKAAGIALDSESLNLIEWINK